ncbi:MAG: phosphatase PAP2 family protein [Oscillospiraceae bacterium]|nr:phosphatase PAP2 family protein [Oscillospiraceae bacterium]
MQRQFYTKMVRAIAGHKTFSKWLVRFCNFAPWITMVIFGITLAVLLITWNLKWIFFAIVPALSFLLVTLLRNALNRPRPFERFSYEPLLKHGSGKSFPSRHTACAVAIAMACWYLHPAFGIPMMVLAAGVGVSRVLTGLHHIVDVLAGGAISVALGLLGYLIFAPMFGL